MKNFEGKAAENLEEALLFAINRNEDGSFPALVYDNSYDYKVILAQAANKTDYISFSLYKGQLTEAETGTNRLFNVIIGSSPLLDDIKKRKFTQRKLSSRKGLLVDLGEATENVFDLVSTSNPLPENAIVLIAPDTLIARPLPDIKPVETGNDFATADQATTTNEGTSIADLPAHAEVAREYTWRQIDGVTKRIGRKTVLELTNGNSLIVDSEGLNIQYDHDVPAEFAVFEAGKASEFSVSPDSIERLANEVDLKKRLESAIEKIDGAKENDTKVIKDEIIEIQKGLVDVINKLLEGQTLTDAARGELMRQFIDSWATTQLSFVHEFVGKLAKKLSVKNLRLSAWSGPQGTGKGTNIQAITSTVNTIVGAVGEASVDLPADMSSFMSKFSGNTSEVITGTGGMFNKPDGEYKEIFAQMGELGGAVARTGRLVGDEFTSIFTELMIGLRMAAGANTIQVDLWPRSTKQMEYSEELIEVLNGNGTSCAIEMLDLRLVSPEVVERIKANRPEYIAASSKLAGDVKKLMAAESFTNANAESIKLKADEKLKDAYNLEAAAVKELLKNLQKAEGANQAYQDMFSELQTSITRMDQRYRKAEMQNKEPRLDEMPMTALTRLVSYFGNTAPAQMKSEQVAILSTLDTPENVVVHIFNVLIEQGNVDKTELQNKTIIEKLNETIRLVAATLVSQGRLDSDNLVQFAKHIIDGAELKKVVEG